MSPFPSNLSRDYAPNKLNRWVQEQCQRLGEQVRKAVLYGSATIISVRSESFVAFTRQLTFPVVQKDRL